MAAPLVSPRKTLPIVRRSAPIKEPTRDELRTIGVGVEIETGIGFRVAPVRETHRQDAKGG